MSVFKPKKRTVRDFKTNLIQAAMKSNTWTQQSCGAAINAYEIKVMPQLIRYLHAAAGFIPKSTWIKCINAGFYATWSGLMASKVQKYLPD